MAALRATTDLELEFHGHDDLGLATANTLAAIKAGATHASVTVIGLGERAGNAPLEEVAVALRQLYGRETGIVLSELGNVAAVVAAAAARTIPLNKAIVGEHVFTHESGIHVDGLLKDQRTYQSLDPLLFGRSNRIVIGKHSGLSAITSLLSDLHLPASVRRARRDSRPACAIMRSTTRARSRARPSRGSGARSATRDFPIVHEAAHVRCRDAQPPSRFSAASSRAFLAVAADQGRCRLRPPARSRRPQRAGNPADLSRRPCLIWHRIAHRLWESGLAVSGAAVVVVRPLPLQCRHSSGRQNRPSVLHRSWCRCRDWRDRRGRQ